METAHLPATPTSPTGPQMPVRVARPCGCARVAQIFVARVVAHICVDAAQVDDVVAMLEQKEVESLYDTFDPLSLEGQKCHKAIPPPFAQALPRHHQPAPHLRKCAQPLGRRRFAPPWRSRTVSPRELASADQLAKSAWQVGAQSPFALHLAYGRKWRKTTLPNGGRMESSQIGHSRYYTVLLYHYCTTVPS